MKRGNACLLPVLGLALLTLPEPTAADPVQGGRIPKIGYLAPISREQQAPYAAAFVQGLRDLGYVEGQNIAIEWRFANGQADRLGTLAAELVKQKVDVIAVVSSPAAQAAKQVTSTIPIAMVYGTDPVEEGLAVSLAHPGGNVTGLSFMGAELATKQLELLKAVVPNISRVAVVRLPSQDHIRIANALPAVGARIGVGIRIFEAGTADEYQQVFKTMSKDRVDAVLLLGSPIGYANRARLAALAIKYRLPMASSIREFAEAGFLLSYSPNILSVYRHAAKYVDRLLKGANPSELPIEQPTQFELVINMKTAKTIGVAVLDSVLVRADEVLH
jgi:putative tryptophan/tyrosine transport system substrate-binding protein